MLGEEPTRTNGVTNILFVAFFISLKTRIKKEREVIFMMEQSEYTVFKILKFNVRNLYKDIYTQNKYHLIKEIRTLSEYV